MPHYSKPPIVAIVGPTASGKTALAIHLAQHFTGEVISVDSRQVYRGLDIGTAKVTEEEMHGVPHHLIDCVDLETVYTAHDFERDAHATLTEIQKRGHLPIVAGGTIFYLNLLRGIMHAAPVPPNPALREKLETVSTSELVAQLTTLSPQRAAMIDLDNRRRLIRAIEIATELGDNFPPTPTDTSPYRWRVIGCEVPKDELRARYRVRATSWLHGGFPEEVTELLARGVSRSRLAEIGFEYTLMLRYLDKEIDEATFIDQFEQKNWQYAKRQLTWLKRDEEIAWVNPKEMDRIVDDVETFLLSDT